MKKISRRMIKLVPAVLALVILVSMLACSSGYNSNSSTSKTTTTSATSAPASGSSVNISGDAFVPAGLSVSVGTTVTWTNKDSITHTVTSDNGVFDSGNLSGGKTFSYTFNQAGTFSYHCGIHTFMKATVTVK
jgi:plastocyanin